MKVKILCPDGKHFVRVRGDGILDAVATVADAWETFELLEFPDGRIALRTLSVHPQPDQYVRSHRGGGGPLSADRSIARDHEKFMRVPLAGGKTAIQTRESNYWRAKNLGGAELDCLATAINTWEHFAIQEA